MKKVILMLVIAGALTKVEQITYQDGTVVQRIYAQCNDIIPADIVWVKTAKPLAPSQIIEHREVELYNFHMGGKC